MLQVGEAQVQVQKQQRQLLLQLYHLNSKSAKLKLEKMGLSHYPSAAEGMLPALVMNTVVTVAILKSMVRWVLQVIGCVENRAEFDFEEEEITSEDYPVRNRSISITLFKSLCRTSGGAKSGSGGGGGACPVECCVCLHGFEAEEEVSELSCKHFFHKSCLEKWLDHKHSTCPLCRSTF